MDEYTVDIITLSQTEKPWKFQLTAMIDTGAKRSSIDEMLATLLQLEPVGEIKVSNAMGKQESPVDKTTQIYFITDPILVFDLAYKNKEVVIAKSMTGNLYNGQHVLNMIHYHEPQNRIYAVGKRLS